MALNPSLIGQLTSQKSPGPANVLGAASQGIKNATNLQAIQNARFRIQKYQDAEDRQNAIREMLSVTPPEKQAVALAQMGEPGLGASLGNMYNNQNVLTDQRDAAKRSQLARANFRQTLPIEEQTLFDADPAGYVDQELQRRLSAPDYDRVVNREGEYTYLRQPDAMGQVGDPINTGVFAQDKGGDRIEIFDPASGNMLFSSGPDRGTNPLATSPLSKKGGEKVEGRLINTGEQLARLRSVAYGYDQRFLQAGSKGFALTDDLMSKFNLGTADPEEQQFLNEMYTFYSDTFDNLSQTLKEMSGAAVNEHEMKRLLQSLPNPGELGLFSLLSGDGPTKFEAKLRGAIRRAELGIARYNYYRNSGRIDEYWREIEKKTGPFQGASILPGASGESEMEQIIDRRGNELESIVREQFSGSSDAEIQDQVTGLLSEEFGIQIGVLE